MSFLNLSFLKNCSVLRCIQRPPITGETLLYTLTTYYRGIINFCESAALAIQSLRQFNNINDWGYSKWREEQVFATVNVWPIALIVQLWITMGNNINLDESYRHKYPNKEIYQKLISPWKNSYSEVVNFVGVTTKSWDSICDINMKTTVKEIKLCFYSITINY